MLLPTSCNLRLYAVLLLLSWLYIVDRSFWPFLLSRQTGDQPVLAWNGDIWIKNVLVDSVTDSLAMEFEDTDKSKGVAQPYVKTLKHNTAIVRQDVHSAGSLALIELIDSETDPGFIIALLTDTVSHCGNRALLVFLWTTWTSWSISNHDCSLNPTKVITGRNMTRAYGRLICSILVNWTKCHQCPSQVRAFTLKSPTCPDMLGIPDGDVEACAIGPTQARC